MACCTLFFLALAPQQAKAQVTFDSASNTTGTSTSLTWSHTVGAGANRILIVGVSNRHGAHYVSSITYGGTALAQIGGQSNITGAGNRVDLWYLLAPPTGTANIVVSLTSSRAMAAGAVSFSGVDQTTPLGTFASAFGTGTTASVNVTSSPYEVVVGAVAANGPANSLATGPLQTSRWNTGTGTGGQEIRGAGSTEPGAASVTMSWTLGSSELWSIGGVSVKPVIAGGISGNVFEDFNYGGGAGRSLVASGGSLRANARVELYDALGLLVSSTITNASGAYSFTSLLPGDYTVRVVNSTVTSSRIGYVPTLIPVQTFRTDGSSGSAVADTNRVGGEDPTRVDAPSNTSSTTLASLTIGTTTAQSITPVTVGVTVVSGVDFGFNFDTIVSTRDAGQGSLRQFILNSNALGNGALAQVGQAAGTEASIFMISDGAAHPGLQAGLANQLTGGVAIITPISLLPQITNATTAIDGTTQTSNVGNTNSGTLGVGGLVGVDNLSLSTVERPEVQLVDNSGLVIGLDVQASNTTIRGLSIYGFGTSANTDGHANIRIGNFAGTLIWQNVLGSGATSFTDPGGGVRSIGDNIRSRGDNGIVRNNLIGFSQGRGFGVESTSTGWLIENNEIRGNAINNSNLDGIAIENASGGATVRGNLVLNNEGVGVDSYQSSGGNTIVNNTVTGNGFGPGANVETAGVRLFGTGSIVDRNIITGNFGAGVMVTDGSDGNTITRNSIYANGTTSGQIGIDLLTPTDDLTKGTAPFVTPNDSGDGDAGGNGLLNFPVFTSAALAGGNLTVSGYARAGTALELFIAAPDPSGFGEGQTYLVSLTEGSAADLDTGTDTYTSPVNGLNVGTDTTNRFSFFIPAPGGVAVGTVLTATGTIGSNTSEFSGNVTVQPASSGLVITPDAATHPSVVAGQATALFNFTVTNTGNLADQVRFLANGASAQVTGPAIITNIVIDTDNSQTVTVGDVDIKNNPADVLSAWLPPDGSFNVIVRIRVDLTAVQGDAITITLGDAATGGPGFDDQAANSTPNEVRTVVGGASNGLREARGDRTALVDNDAQIWVEMTAPSGPVLLGSDITYTIQLSNPGLRDLGAETLINAPAGSDTGVFIIAPIPIGTVLKSGQVFPAGTLYTISPLSTDPLTATWTTLPPADLTTVTRIAFNLGPTIVVGGVIPGTSFIVTITTTDQTNPIEEIVDAFGRNSIGAGLTDQSGDISRTAGDGNANFDEGPLRGTIDGDGIIQLTTLQAVGSLLLGPLGQPGAVGPTDNNDDYTNRSVIDGIAGVAPGGMTTAGSTVIFTNTLQNTGNGVDTFTLTAPTAPAGFTIEISVNNGGSYTTAQPGNGSVNVAVAFGASANILVRVTAPSGLAVLSPYATVIRATSTNTPAATNDTINRVYTGYVRLEKTATVSNTTGVGGATDPVPGAVITYTVTYTNVTAAGGTNNADLIAYNLVITEDGNAAGNNWGSTTDHVVGATDTRGGTITGDVAGSSLLTDTITPLPPGESGIFTFRRTIR